MFTYMLLIAVAAADPTAIPAQEPTEPAKEEKVVCKSKKFVGSNVSQRICKTESEWRIGKEDAQRALDQAGARVKRQSPLHPTRPRPG